MKSRLNITIEDNLLEHIKLYASQKKTSVSKLIEQYFKTLTTPSSSKKEENLIEFLDKLPKPKRSTEHYSKESYYEENAKKYGF
ncbi:MAG: DUF6364 family protein [Sediminibacterium sp.]|jgi:hypothetical protein|nr:hypothetical protein [Chitinophagaceae bacterium]